MGRSRKLLPISQRPLPPAPAWENQPSFLIEAGVSSLRTEMTYKSGLRLFADWLQHFKRDGFSYDTAWPLSPASLTTATILRYRNWLLANRAPSTVTTYTAALMSYLNFLDGLDLLPEGVQIGKLQRQLRKQRADRHQAETVVDLDIERLAIPQIVQYYERLPLPLENDAFNRRLSLLRDRALVHLLYSTAARISEIVALNRSNVNNGRSPYATVTGKGNKPRTLHIRDYAQRALHAYISEREDTNRALFVAHSRNANGARLTTMSVHTVVKKAVKALDLHPSLSAHDFRHFRATQLLREGMPIEVVQEFLGHADITTTRNIYAPVLGVQIVSEWLDNLDVAPDKTPTPPQN